MKLENKLENIPSRLGAKNPEKKRNRRHGCKLLSGNGFCLSGKANLLPLAFYTIEFTSPAIWALMLPLASRQWEHQRPNSG